MKPLEHAVALGVVGTSFKMFDVQLLQKFLGQLGSKVSSRASRILRISGVILCKL